jgi:hypothetical protein
MRTSQNSYSTQFVNKGKAKGRSYDAPALGLMDSLLCYSVVSSTQPPPVVLPVVVP